MKRQFQNTRTKIRRDIDPDFQNSIFLRRRLALPATRADHAYSKLKKAKKILGFQSRFTVNPSLMAIAAQKIEKPIGQHEPNFGMIRKALKAGRCLNLETGLGR